MKAEVVAGAGVAMRRRLVLDVGFVLCDTCGEVTAKLQVRADKKNKIKAKTKHEIVLIYWKTT